MTCNIYGHGKPQFWSPNLSVGKFAESNLTFFTSTLYEVQYFVFSAVCQTHTGAIFGEKKITVKKLDKATDQKGFHVPNGVSSSLQYNTT